MRTVFLSGLFAVGCLCGTAPASRPQFDETGLLEEPPVRYEVRVRKNAATVTVNAMVKLAVCVSFSEGCRLRDLERPYPRFRQYEDSVEIQPFLRGGPNEVLIQRRPDGEDETLYFSVVRVEDRTESILAEGEIEATDKRAHTVRIETPDTCTPPHLPELAWLANFLDPLPEALRTMNGVLYEKLLVPPASEAQSKLRSQAFESLQDNPLMGTSLPASAILQDHRVVPLAMNYSCENERLFVFPQDGADLITIARIEEHDAGRSSESVTLRAASLVFHQGRWYLGAP